MKMRVGEIMINDNKNSPLETDIDGVTISLSRPNFRSALKRLAVENPQNARLICDYILDE